MIRDELRSAVFGVVDGTTSVLGVILGLGLERQHALLLAAVGLAVSSAMGMAGGDWLADNGHGYGAAATIGVATAVGTMLPVLPCVLLSGTWAVLGAVLVVLAIGAVISVARGGRPVHWAQTFGILAVASGASIVAAVALGGGA